MRRMTRGALAVSYPSQTVSGARAFVLGEIMAARRPFKIRKPVMTMHGLTAKHYILAAVIILIAMGMFAYSWS
jgi:hypothetical protein